jgi:hypothetical protein
MTALAVSTAFAFYVPEGMPGDETRFRKTSFISLCLLILFSMGVVYGAIGESGISFFWLDLLQYRTTDRLILYGSHWHSHLLHLAFIPPAAAGFMFLYRAFTDAADPKMNLRAQAALGIWLALFLLISLVFLTPFTPFRNTRQLAHQFREIVTHATVTLPLAFAVLIFFEGKTVKKSSLSSSPFLKKGVLSFILSFSVPLFILVQLRGRDILGAAQKKTGFGDLLASHYFEHSLDYFFVPVLSLMFYLMMDSKREPKGPPS